MNPALPAASATVEGRAEMRLAVTDISKRFGGTRALDRVSLHVGAGEIVAFLGENGAGKSTLIKVLAGVHDPDGGTISYRGRDATGHVRHLLPIAFIHQDLGLIDWMTVSENMCLALGYPRRLGMIDQDAAARRAAQALGQLGVSIDPHERVGRLGRTERSLVAIARALASDAELVVLDEPTASLPADEVARLFEVLRRLRAQGVGMIYVSHRLDEVFEIADRMVVLRDGRVVADRPVVGATARDVILAIVGREPSQVFRRSERRRERVRLVLDDLQIGAVGPVSCEVHAGEVVGFVGLRGAGQEAVGRALFGVHETAAGRILLDGITVSPASPGEAMRAGIRLVSGDRVGESAVANMSVRENLFLNPIAAGRSQFRPIRPRREAAAARALGGQVGLRPNDPAMPIEALSGGNQQKVVMGRWLYLGGAVYVLEDPTAGVDVGAKADIYRLFDEALRAEAAIIIISTDFEEVANVCHRALVFDRGRVVAELSGERLSVSALLAAASAGTVEGGVTACSP